MANIVILLILSAIIGGAMLYIVKAKKSGVKCIGCPSAKTCSSHKNIIDLNNSCCSCNCKK